MIKVKNPTGHIIELGERPEYGDTYRVVSVNGFPAHTFLPNPITFVAKSEVENLPRVEG